MIMDKVLELLAGMTLEDTNGPAGGFVEYNLEYLLADSAFKHSLPTEGFRSLSLLSYYLRTVTGAYASIMRILAADSVSTSTE
jgi:hypothetical protein